MDKSTECSLPAACSSVEPKRTNNVPAEFVPEEQSPLLWPEEDPLQPLGVPPTAICGVDEAGRGPLAGPVVAAAVILDPDSPVPGLADSKALTEVQRTELAWRIREQALAWCIASADAAEIDQLNILQATMLAMQRAVEGVGLPVSLAQIDGDRAPRLACSVQLVIKGDARVANISAASILAKTARDALLEQLHEYWPMYEFASHKGYATPVHRATLIEHGASPEHRRSFRPVRDALEAAGLPLTRAPGTTLLQVHERGGTGLATLPPSYGTDLMGADRPTPVLPRNPRSPVSDGVVPAPADPPALP